MSATRFLYSASSVAAVVEPVFGPDADPGWQRHYVDLPGTGRSRPVEPQSDAVLEAVAQTVALRRALIALQPDPILRTP